MTEVPIQTPFSNYIEEEWKNGTRFRYFKLKGENYVAIYPKGQKAIMIDEKTLKYVLENMSIQFSNKLLADHDDYKEVVKKLEEVMKE